jgi:NADH-quinone oxidoreductase subunit G
MHDVQLDANLKASGLSADSVKDAVKRLAASGSVAIIAGTEFLRYPEGTAALGLLKDLLKSKGKKVSVLPVLDRANQRGAWEMGVHPGFGPGYTRARKGLGTEGMLEAAIKGELEALYLVGSDVASMFPDDDFARTALSKVKFLIVQDMFMSETARVANVVLPGASHAEKDGTFTNQEGRAQIIKKLLGAPGKAKQDINIIRAIGESFDRSFGPKHFALVLDEIRKEVPMYSDVSLAFNNKRNSDNKLDNRAALIKAAEAPSVSALNFNGARTEESAARFVLATGNHLFHSGRFSRKSETLLGLLKGAVVEISDEDAGELGLKNGDKVRVKGTNFEAMMTLITKKGTKSGVAFIGENFDEAPVNRYFRRGRGIPRVDIIKTI